MSDEEVIVVEADESGKVKVSTPCSEGKECVDVSKFLEEDLGSTESVSKTSSYYRQRRKKRIAVIRNVEGT